MTSAVATRAATGAHQVGEQTIPGDAEYQERPRPSISEREYRALTTAETDIVTITANLGHQMMLLDFSDAAFAVMLKEIDARDESRLQAGEAYKQYRDELDKIEVYAVSILRETGSLFAQLAGLPREERKAAMALNLEIAESFRGAFGRVKPKLKAALANFETSLDTALTEPERLRLPAAMRSWRRSFMLNPVAVRSQRGAAPVEYSGPAPGDLAAHVDLCAAALACAAACPDARAWFVATTAAPSAISSTPLAEAHKMVDASLERYELALDERLKSRYWLDIEDRARARVARMTDDIATSQRIWDGIDARSVEVFRLTEQVVMSIAATIEEAGDSVSADAWRTHCYLKLFPRTYAPKSADWAHTWLTHAGRLNAEVLSNVEVVYISHCRDREAVRATLRRRLLEEIAKDAVTHATILAQHAAGSGLPPALDASIRSLRALNDAAIEALASLLDAEVQAALHVALTAARQPTQEGVRLEF